MKIFMTSSYRSYWVLCARTFRERFFAITCFIFAQQENHASINLYLCAFVGML